MRAGAAGRFVFALTAAAVCLAPAVGGCGAAGRRYRSFADYPGFEEFYGGRCLSPEPPPGPENIRGESTRPDPASVRRAVTSSSGCPG